MRLVVLLKHDMIMEGMVLQKISLDEKQVFALIPMILIPFFLVPILAALVVATTPICGPLDIGTRVSKSSVMVP
jgi:hypothetical protein